MFFAVVGATGVGKSRLSLDIAHEIERTGRRAEIVNADAMQLYRGMDIGTAKLSVPEREGVTHHLIDVLDVTDEATVAWYQHRAREVILDIQSRDAVPILVGGSGLYVSSVLFDFTFPGHEKAIRRRLEEDMRERGPAQLHAELSQRAPSLAQRIDPKNERRIIRALEVIEISGDAPSLGALPDAPATWQHVRLLGLTRERASLTQLLDRRVETMWNDGLLDEVRTLIPLGIESGVTARRAIGYAQALAEVQGLLTTQEAMEQTQSLTRRYARRQASWFRRYQGVSWMDAGSSIDIRRLVDAP